MKYKIIERKGPLGVSRSILRDDGAFIPLDLDNRDYREFVKDWRGGAVLIGPDDAPIPYTNAAAAALGLEYEAT